MFEDDLKEIREALLMRNGLRPISSFISEAGDLSETVTELRPDCRGYLVDRVTVYGKDRITFTITTGMGV